MKHKISAFLLAWALAGSVIAGSSVTTPNPKIYTDALRADFANSAEGKGAGLVGFRRGESGAVPRTLLEKSSDVLDIRDFGADPAGIIDSTAAFTNAMAALPHGGKIKLAGRYLIGTNITVPVGVSLEGDCLLSGSPGYDFGASFMALKCGIVMIASSATINMSAGSGLASVIIYRAGMTFPAANSALFAGTAITAAGDDVSVSRVMVMGFNTGFKSLHFQRTRIEYFYGDNNNGIEIGDSTDIAYINNAHQWPFATIASGGALSNHIRPGVAYHIHDTADWAKISDSFSWGYGRGVRINNANSVTLIGVGTDNAFAVSPQHAASIGIEILGASHDTRLIGCQTAAQATAGVFVNTDAGAITTISGHNIWGGSDHGILVYSGDIVVSGSVMRGIKNGISETNSESRITVTGNKFADIFGHPINAVAPSSLIFLASNDFGNFAGQISAGTITSQSVESAAWMVLPNTGDVFNVTGSVNTGTLYGGWAGRQVTLIFEAPMTIYNGNVASTDIKLKGSANMVAAAGDTLTLLHNGVRWYEVGRSN